MTMMIATSGGAGPLIYIVLGAVLSVVGTILASDLRGIGSKYIQIALPKNQIDSDSRSSLITRYRVMYGIAVAVGLGMIISGIAQH
jgi:hypothetical protein